jgi:serine protease Do
MRRFFLIFLLLVIPFSVFSQAASSSGLRDYVGLINQTYHPGVVDYFEKLKEEIGKRSGSEAASRAIDIFLRGDVGSGFVYSDARGNLYVLTNNHVITQAYSLSITFERQDGTKRRFDNLKIIAADEENDLAILSFAPGDRPIARGLSFLTRPVNEGEDVYSAGFPGLGTTPLWQFGRGMVSNANARFPKSLEDETLMGPFIQHTAEIDPGNSGGPLLIADRNATGGYYVAGINTLKATRRQAANYAIPIRTIQTFVTAALNQRPDTYRDALDTRLENFLEGLNVNKAVYPHIAEYLSPNCVGENAEYAIQEMYEKGGASARQSFTRKMEEDGVVEAIGYAVAWTIENSIRGQGAIKAAIKEVTGEGEEYTVVFTINNKDHSSTWVWEYGNWRIRVFGTVAAGDKELLAKKERQKKNNEKLRTDSWDFHVQAGYAYLFSKAPAALYASIDISFIGLQFFFAGPEFISIGGFFGWRGDFQAGSVGFMPFIRGGFEWQFDRDYKDWNTATDHGFAPIAINAQAGLKVTTSYVPGLFIGVGFQYNVFNLHGLDPWDISNPYYCPNKMKMALIFSAGYAF